MQKLLHQCYEEAKQILVNDRALLDEISEYLLVKETITGEELMAFVKAAKEAPVVPEKTEEIEDTTEE